MLCRGNSCKSQMVHGFLQSLNKNLSVCSAATFTIRRVYPRAVQVVNKMGIDISFHTADPVEKYVKKERDSVITVYGSAKEMCPAFIGNVKKTFPYRIR